MRSAFTSAGANPDESSWSKPRGGGCVVIWALPFPSPCPFPLAALASRRVGNELEVSMGERGVRGL
jgi:hypothetical protein